MKNVGRTPATISKRELWLSLLGMFLAYVFVAVLLTNYAVGEITQCLAP